MKNLLFCILVLLIGACGKKKPSSSIPDNNFAAIKTLAKGINLSNWFNDYSNPAEYSNRFTIATLQLIKQKGFTYVRIPIGDKILFDNNNPSILNSANLTLVDNAIGNCMAAGLGVTINIHPWKNDTDSLLAASPVYVQKIKQYWKAMAGYFKKYDTAKLFFEVLNEPHASSGGLTALNYSWWQPVQLQLMQGIREATADHYIIAGGEGWNSIDGLKQLQPYAVPKIIYNFHFYDPFLFTHQGASWAGWAPAVLGSNIPYPSSPEAIAPLVSAASNTELKNALNWYGSQRINIDSLDKWIKVAADWAALNNVPLIANEFGSYAAFAPRQSRINYIKDVRTVFEKYKIGWAMWECDEGFGWLSYPTGNRNNPVADAEILQALGL